MAVRVPAALRPAARAVALLLALAQVSLHLLSTFLLLDGLLPPVRAAFSAAGAKLPLRRLQAFLLRTWMAPFMHHMEVFGGLTLDVTGDAFRAGESAIITPNHRTWTDTIVVYSTARQVRADGDVKFLTKKILMLAPVIGPVGKWLDASIFIRREMGKASRRMARLFDVLSDPEVRRPFWFISYLEGTRLTRQKLADARDFAKKRDLKQLNHVLQPRVKGFVASVHELRGCVDAVYDLTIGYEEDADLAPVPSFAYLVSRWCFGEPRRLAVHQRRIPMDQVPEDEEQIKEWVYKLFEEKDALLEEKKRTGAFPGDKVEWKRIDSAYAMTCFFVFNFLGLLVAAALFLGARYGWAKWTGASAVES